MRATVFVTARAGVYLCARMFVCKRVCVRVSVRICACVRECIWCWVVPSP